MGDVQVRWSRGDGRRLQRNSRQRGGFLYLRDLSRADEGRYTCRGVDATGRTLFQEVGSRSDERDLPLLTSPGFPVFCFRRCA